MLMSPQMRLLFQPRPTPIERMPAARPMDTALPPPIEYMTSSPMTGPLVWKPACAHARPQTRASAPASAVGRSGRRTLADGFISSGRFIAVPSIEIDAAEEHLAPAFAARIGPPQRPGVVALFGLCQEAVAREDRAGRGQDGREFLPLAGRGIALHQRDG